MKDALAALRKGRCSNEQLRTALPTALDLYHGMVAQLSGPKASVEDLCVLIRHVRGSAGCDAAERLLTDPKLVLDEATLVLILNWVVEHREAAAFQLILDRNLSRETLADIIMYTNDHAHEAATRLMAMEPTDTELGLIVARVPTLADAACQRLGAMGGISRDVADA